MSEHGFELVSSAGGYSLKFVMPKSLEGVLQAEMICRGALLDGTCGNPREIERRIKGYLGEDRLAAPIQVHGTAVHQARAIWALPGRVRADGVHLDSAFGGGVVPSLRYGDCAPVLIASDYPRPWALMLHSGFRGTMKNIAGKSLNRMKSYYGEIDPLRVYAWIGPTIGFCCYTRKISDPASAEAASLLGTDFCTAQGDEVRIDIPGAISAQLQEAGVSGGNVKALGMCTRCHTRYFYSYRGEDELDRMILLVKLKT